jgi:uncharacterized membrane protein
MPRVPKSISSFAGRMGLMAVLGAGIGTALGAIVGNVPYGAGLGAVCGLVVGAMWGLWQRRKRRVGG